ncbi:unnamed protein product [Oreochromis niloticus]|nr:unnamed protein product [Mustela putorius furo]
MSAGTASHCYNLLFFSVFVFVSAGQKNITAESGQDVTLTCRASNKNIKSVHWSRADLTDKYVLLYQDGQFVPEHQHPSFKNRVDLQDRQMKDGDVSLILKNVTINDTGTYECRVVQRVRGPVTLISITNLTVVVPPGQTGGQEKDEDNKDRGKEDKEKEDGSVGLIVGLTVSAVLLVAVVGFLIYKGCKLNPADPHEAEHLQPEYQKNIPAESGQDVTLTCRAVNNESDKMNQQLHQPEVDPT